MSVPRRAVAQSSASAERTITCRHALGIAHVGPVCLVVWHDAVTPDRFELQRSALRSLAAQQAQPIGFICVVQPTAPPPDAAMRRASVALIDELGPRLECVACVIEGSGLVATTTRSVLSAMAVLLRRATRQIKFTDSVTAAATWMESRCAGASATVLLAAHANLLVNMPNALPTQA